MFEVVPISAFQDNYIWTLRDRRNAVVVDPGEAQPVLDYLAREQLALSGILLTHHHADHVGGVAGIVHGHDVPVYGPHDHRISGITHRVGQGDTLTLPEFDLRFDVLEVPGHTLTHIAYYGANMLFCGDTLFACGCGRLFEGTPEQMVASLAKLAALPDDTQVYCGHEYTLANIGFAKYVEPGNTALGERATRDAQTRKHFLPTLPSTIGREKATNPFLRYREPEVVASASRHAGSTLDTPVAVFAAIRAWKNNY